MADSKSLVLQLPLTQEKMAWMQDEIARLTLAEAS